MKPFDKGLQLIGTRPMPRDIARRVEDIQQQIDDPLEFYAFKRLYAPILLHLIKLATPSCKRTNKYASKRH
jgi:hypothetical protein